MDYKLVWQDLFDQNKLDLSIWNIETGGHGFGNNEDQFYTNQEKNIFIQDRVLNIVAHKEKFENRNYTSAKITTKNKKHIKYGRVEVMAQVPKGMGTWPAIWLLGENINENGWPLCGEIDIMEHVGNHKGFFHFSLHSKSFNHNIQNQPTYVYENSKLLDGFHLYSIEWCENEISFFIDDLHMVTFKKQKDASKEQWPFDQPFYIILNLAIGGNWGGNIDDGMFPISFKIEHVKVYERSDKK
ncbi:MAG: glycoside hydrolase family 16 protein [Acholeplasmataceae bacterium]|nr:glycoside hydrolase family 16 protein [Acholeplasmataceae bacterium]